MLLLRQGHCLRMTREVPVLARYITKRILQAVPLLIIISIICFALIQAAPFDVIDTIATPDMAPEVKEALKVKYARDNITSQMLDIIHDNLRLAFPFAYNSYLAGNLLQHPFLDPLQNNSTDFASNMAKIIKPVEAAMEEMIEKYNEQLG